MMDYTIQDSVQEQEGPESYGRAAVSFYYPAQRDILQPWGTYEREIQLRRFYRALHNTLIQGSIAGFVKRVKATPWEVQGGRNLTFRAQEFLQDAQFEHGWGVFISKVILDYLTQDKGAFIEVMGPGKPDGELTGRVTGLAHLDARRCYLTGNLEFPVIYYARRTGKLHRLHRSRVIHLPDMPDTDDDYFNWGFCALSRMIGVSNLQIGLSKYQTERLNNVPPAGILTVSGITMKQFEDAKAAFEAGRTEGGADFWRGVFTLAAPDPENPLKIETHEFASLPEHFDYAQYIDVHVNLVALALGVDRQEIWTLNSGQMGTATQSLILHEKARGKGYADVLSMLERAINTKVLPDSLEFSFEFEDQEQDAQQAERAEKWVNIANSAPGLSDEQRLRLLANNVKPLAEVILDENGEVQLPDDDKLPNEPEPAIEASATDANPAGTEADATANDGDGGTDFAQRSLDGHWRRRFGVHRKEFDATAAEFFRNLVDLFQAGANGDITSRRFDTVMRAQLTRLGRRAYLDGMEAGGVTVDLLEGDDATAFAGWLAEQSSYITNLTTSLYQTEPSPDALVMRARMWVNKGLQGAFDLGRLSADANGMYEFAGTDGLESCATCTRLKGQRHRLKDWTRRKLRPGVDTEAFECGGWNCAHFLKKVNGKARGRL